MPLKYSTIFGGNPSQGDATTEAGIDCIVNIVGGPQSVAIRSITYSYSLATITDWQRVGGGAGTNWKSLSGRIVVFETLPNYVPEDLSVGGPPSPMLSTALPDTIAQRVLFDQLIHGFPVVNRQLFFHSKIGGLGSLVSKSGNGLAVLLVAGSGYDDLNTLTYFTRQHLHVEAEVASISSEVEIGKFSTRGK